MKNHLTNESARVMDKYEKSLEWRLAGKNNKAYPRLSGIRHPGAATSTAAAAAVITDAVSTC